DGVMHFGAVLELMEEEFGGAVQPARVGGGSGASGGYLATVQRVMVAEGKSQAEAVSIVNERHPELRKAYATGADSAPATRPARAASLSPSPAPVMAPPRAAAATSPAGLGFMGVVEGLMRSGKSRAEAINEAHRTHPELHAAYAGRGGAAASPRPAPDRAASPRPAPDRAAAGGSTGGRQLR